MTHIIALDIEASGQNVWENDVLAIGGAVVSVCEGTIVSSFFAVHESVSTIPSPPAILPRWDPATFTGFWMNPEKGAGQMPITRLQALAASTTPATHAEMANALAAWLRNAFSRFPDAVIVVDTVSFDTTFLNVLLARYTDMDNLLYARGKYRVVRDLTSWAYGLTGRSFARAKGGAVDQACARLGITPPDSSMHDHNPMHDAVYIGLAAAELCRALE